MYSSMDSQSLPYGSLEGAAYRLKNILDWYGEECLAWASDAEKELNIPYTSWVSIDGFRSVTGRELIKYSVDDFKRIVNDEYGPLFHKVFKKFLKEQKQAKDLNASGNMGEFPSMDTSSYLMDNSSWTVPQIGTNDLSIPQITYGSSYTDLPAMSPSLPIDVNSSFLGLSPSYSHFEGGSFGGLSPSHPLDGGACSSFGRQDELAPKYFTQPSILSGGSLSYGSTNGNLLSPNESSFDCQSNDLSCSSLDGSDGAAYDSLGYSTVIPDFKALIIQDNEQTFSEYLDIDNLDCSLREETFRDLDHFIHNDETLKDNNFEIGNEYQNSYGNTSHLSTSDCGTLEDSMLKKITTGKRGNRVRHPQSWEFLVRLLMNPQSNPSLVKWENKEEGVFRLVQKEEIAKLWGKRSQKHKDEPLAYDNFARILRYHYKSKVLVPVSDKHLVYRLGDKVLADLKKQGLL